MASPTKIDEAAMEHLKTMINKMEQSFMDAMIHGTGARQAGKSVSLTEMYGMDLYAAAAGVETGRVSRMQRSSMHKRDFERLAVACQGIELGLKRDLGLATPARDKIMEIVVAQIALACHDQNNEFDSFKFNAAARKRKP